MGEEKDPVRTKPLIDSPIQKPVQQLVQPQPHQVSGWRLWGEVAVCAICFFCGLTFFVLREEWEKTSAGIVTTLVWAAGYALSKAWPPHIAQTAYEAAPIGLMIVLLVDLATNK